jgi:hypothetical protein
MKKQILAAALALSALACAIPARAHNEASAVSALSALPLASVVVGASALVALPVALSATGTVLVVKTAESTARGTVYLLERASDGARVSVEVAASAVGHLSLAAGTAVAVTVIGSGVILSAAGEAIAFVPNALGRALLHNERLTH